MAQQRNQGTAQPPSDWQTVQGDEREQSVYNAGGALGTYIGMFLCFFTALGFALFGHVLVPLVLMVVAAVPSLVMITYSERRGVDAFAILARNNSRAAGPSNYGALVVLLLIVASMIYTTTSGAGLLEFELTTEWARRLESVGRGAAQGAAVGAVGGYLWAVLLVRKRRKQHMAELTAPDEE